MNIMNTKVMVEILTKTSNLISMNIPVHIVSLAKSRLKNLHPISHPKTGTLYQNICQKGNNILYFRSFNTSLKRKRRTKGKSKVYFTDDTEQAIIDYNNAKTASERNKIYNDKLKFAFEKIAENVFNTFKFSYCENNSRDVQKEVVEHMIMNIHRFKSVKGKAFSYFSIIAKNYLIAQNNNNYKLGNIQIPISDITNNDDDEEKHIHVSLQYEDKYYKETENKELLDSIVDFWDNNAERYFTKQKDLNVVYAVIELFRNCSRIENFNKKTLYLLIREISDCKTQQITKILNRMKALQHYIISDYYRQKPLLVYPEIVL